MLDREKATRMKGLLVNLVYNNIVLQVTSFQDLLNADLSMLLLQIILHSCYFEDFFKDVSLFLSFQM